MNKKTIISALFISLLFLTILGTATAQQTYVGVSEGNTFKYNFVINWSSTRPTDVVPSRLVRDNQTDYFQMRIIRVSSSTVQIESIWRYTNGTQTNSTDIAEVSQGIGNNIFIYATNLTRGDKLYPASDLPWTINETKPIYYSDTSGFRDTNHIEVNRTDVQDQGKLYSYLSLFFDKQTGIVVESFLTEALIAAPNQTTTQHMKLVETNAWAFSTQATPPPLSSISSSPSSQPNTTPSGTENNGSSNPIDPLLILIIVIAIVIPISAFAVLKLGKKKNKEPPAQAQMTSAEPTPTTTSKPLTPTMQPAPEVTPAKTTKTTITCSQCGQQNPPGAQFCNKCGAKLQE
jgi:ribosomal protein L40E